MQYSSAKKKWGQVPFRFAKWDLTPFRRVAVVLLVVLIVPALAGAGRTDRLERRAQEMALPDEVLDPQWPIEFPEPGAGDGELVPGAGDSATDEEYIDEAERQEYERYLLERGLAEDPVAAPSRDPLGRNPDPARTAEGGLGAEYVDPSEW